LLIYFQERSYPPLQQNFKPSGQTRLCILRLITRLGILAQLLFPQTMSHHSNSASQISLFKYLQIHFILHHHRASSSLPFLTSHISATMDEQPMTHTRRHPSCVRIVWGGQYAGKFGVLIGCHSIASNSDSSSGPTLPTYKLASVLWDDGTNISLPSNHLPELPMAISRCVTLTRPLEEYLFVCSLGGEQLCFDGGLAGVPCTCQVMFHQVIQLIQPCSGCMP
jgi:hypothetical protein